MQTLRANGRRSPQTRRLRARAGFTLLEMLLAIGVMGLVMAVTMPNISRTLDSAADRRAVFHFQRLALDLRAAAFREEQGLIVVETGQFEDDGETEPRPAEIKLDDGWSYRLGGPFSISARGICDTVDVDLLYEGRPRMRMRGGADCRFTAERIAG